MSRDIVVVEVYYYVLCYKNYIRDGIKVFEYKDKSNKENEKDGNELY